MSVWIYAMLSRPVVTYAHSLSLNNTEADGNVNEKLNKLQWLAGMRAF